MRNVRQSLHCVGVEKGVCTLGYLRQASRKLKTPKVSTSLFTGTL